MPSSKLYSAPVDLHQVSGADMPQGPFLRITDVAAIGGVQPRAISEYLTQSRPEVGKGAKRRPGKSATGTSPRAGSGFGSTGPTSVVVWSRTGGSPTSPRTLLGWRKAGNHR